MLRVLLRVAEGFALSTNYRTSFIVVVVEVRVCVAVCCLDLLCGALRKHAFDSLSGIIYRALVRFPIEIRNMGALKGQFLNGAHAEAALAK